MINGWTGGQYSLYRAAFGTYLFVHFAYLIPWSTEIFSNQGALPEGSASPLLHLFPNILALWDSPLFVQALLVLGAGLSVLFAVGQFDRVAAVGIWYLLACFFGRNPLIANPALPYLGLLLLAHSFLPKSPYGSWAARDRPDPGGGWKLPGEMFLVVWVLMAVGYSYSGYNKLISPSWVDGSALARVLENPLARTGLPRDVLLAMPDLLLRLATWGALGLELCFALLALLRRVRPWLWAAMLLLHLNLLLVVNFADLTAGMIILHLFTFDPAWVAPRKAAGEETLFYDGHCGLCHRWVRLLLAEGPDNLAMRFSALESDTFRMRVPENARKNLPDSLLLQTAEGALLTRSAAVLHILEALGGVWRVLAVVARFVPTRLRNASYDLVARVRYRLFASPAEACPLVPKHLRSRFL